MGGRRTCLLLVSVFLIYYVRGQCEPLTLVSYNTALIRNTEYYDERKRHILPAISSLDADVLCLQEVSSDVFGKSSTACVFYTCFNIFHMYGNGKVGGKYIS